MKIFLHTKVYNLSTFDIFRYILPNQEKFFPEQISQFRFILEMVTIVMSIFTALNPYLNLKLPRYILMRISPLIIQQIRPISAGALTGPFYNSGKIQTTIDSGAKKSVHKIWTMNRIKTLNNSRIRTGPMKPLLSLRNPIIFKILPELP